MIRSAKDGVLTPRLEAWSRPTKHRGVFLFGMTVCFAGAGLLLAAKVDEEPLICPATLGDDTIDTLQVLAGLSNQVIAATWQIGAVWATASGKSAARVIHNRLLPAPIKQRVDDALENRDWTSKFMRRNGIIVGLSRSGKTTLTKLLIISFVQENLDGFLRICDRNYGKPDPETGEINNWMGLPIEYIAYRDQDIWDAIDGFHEELDRRRNVGMRLMEAKHRGSLDTEVKKLEEDAVFKPALLLIEELPSLMNCAKSKGKIFLEKQIAQITDILTQGLGYRMKLVFVTHTLAVGVIHIPLAVRDQIGICLIQDVAQDKSELKEIGFEEVGEVAGRVRDLRKKHRVAAVQLGETSPGIRVIPDLSWVSNVSFTQSDPLADWWIKVGTEENIQWLRDRATRMAQGETGISPISSANKGEFRSRFGIKPDNSDDRYSRKFKPFWENLLHQAQTQV